MMQRLKVFSPFLFVTLPVLNLLARNPGYWTLADVGWLMSVLLLGCLAVYVVLAAATRARWSSQMVSLVVLALVLWFYSYGMVRWVYRMLRVTPAPAVITTLLLALGAAATIALLRWLARRPQRIDRATTFLAMTGLLLVGWSAIKIVRDQLRSRSVIQASVVARELSRPVGPVNIVAGRPAPVRDIYLLVMDEYAGSMVLEEGFGFDNRAFVDSLRRLGFTIPKVVRSNYVHTILSLPSLLNFSYLTRLSGEIGLRETDAALPNHLVENNRTVAFLKRRGYRFLFFPSQWWMSTRHSRNANWEFQAWSGFHPMREFTRSHLRRVFARGTPLGFFQRDFGDDADHVRRTLAALTQVPSRTEPTFAFAHVLSPHRPYVVDANCHINPKRADVGYKAARRSAYIGQIECLNRRVLGMVNTLLERSSPSPIILLVGDHGTNFLRYSEAKSAETVTPAQARERFGAFGAFHLPDGGGRLIPDSLTLVNVFPMVLNHYFGADLPLAPDSLYMSLEQTPYLFVPIAPSP